MQGHCKAWRCSSGHETEVFCDPAGYISHMEERHKTSLNRCQLRALADCNARYDKALFPKCPLCEKHASPAGHNLESHTIGHMRHLALRFLVARQAQQSNRNRNEDSAFRRLSHQPWSLELDASLREILGLERGGSGHTQAHKLRAVHVPTVQLSQFTGVDYDSNILEPRTNVAGADQLCWTAGCAERSICVKLRSGRFYSRHCRRHTCLARFPWTEGSPVCENARSPENRYCGSHGKCIEPGCVEQAGFDSRVPFPWLCYGHRCKRCTLPKVGHFSVCESHLVCSVSDCANKAEFEFEERGLCCRDHVNTTRCAYEGWACVNPQRPGFRFCYEHLCSYTMCPRERLKGQFCGMHS